MLRGFFDEMQKIAEDSRVEAALSNEVESVEELQKKLKPGDVLFTAPIRSRMKTIFGRYVFKPLSRKLQGTDYGHSSIYVGDGEVVESRMGEGTRTRTLNAVSLKNKIIAFRPRVSLEERKAAVAYAKDQVGVPYAKTHLLASALPVRPSAKEKGVDVDKHICSTLVANAYRDRKFTDVAPAVTRPSEILRSRILKPVAAFRRGP